MLFDSEHPQHSESELVPFLSWADASLRPPSKTRSRVDGETKWRFRIGIVDGETAQKFGKGRRPPSARARASPAATASRRPPRSTCGRLVVCWLLLFSLVRRRHTLIATVSGFNVGEPEQGEVPAAELPRAAGALALLHHRPLAKLAGAEFGGRATRAVPLSPAICSCI